MTPFALYITTAIALIFVIEGLLYALFPDALRRMLAMALSLPVPHLRAFGAGMAAIGFGIILILQTLSGG